MRVGVALEACAGAFSTCCSREKVNVGFQSLYDMEVSTNFNELSAETNVMDESDASSQYSGPILYSGR